MFPPVDEAVLHNNPDFANMYNKLTKVMLNPDGSTKNDPAAKERDAVREELNKHRLKTAKHHLLTRAIATATPPESKAAPLKQISRTHPQLAQSAPPPTLPEPLLDLLLILPPLLSADHSLPPESISLLFSSEPLSSLDTLLPDLTSLVSSTLHASAIDLARIAHSSTNPSYLHRHVGSLPSSLGTLRDNVATAEQSLAAARLHALSALTSLLQSYTLSLAHLIRSLEAKHGVIARSLDLRAASISLHAQRVAVSAENTSHALHRDIYTPEVVAALRNYAGHLRDAQLRIGERIRGLQAELGDYGVDVPGGEGKQRAMKEMARVYREMGRQMGDVEGDLKRLRDG